MVAGSSLGQGAPCGQQPDGSAFSFWSGKSSKQKNACNYSTAHVQDRAVGILVSRQSNLAHLFHQLLGLRPPSRAAAAAHSIPPNGKTDISGQPLHGGGRNGRTKTWCLRVHDRKLHIYTKLHLHLEYTNIKYTRYTTGVYKYDVPLEYTYIYQVYPMIAGICVCSKCSFSHI